jgi:hypothetical protein
LNISPIFIVVLSTLLVPALAPAQQPLRYHPSVGAEFEYGIEYRLICRDAPEHDIRSRVRLRLNIVASDDNGWQATYATQPFDQRGPIANPEVLERYIEQVKMAPSIQESINSATRPPGMSDALWSSVSASRTRVAALRAREAEKYDRYPGMYRFCVGAVQVNSHGEVIKDTGNCFLPLLAGRVVAVPIVRLPEDGDANKKFGYRDVRDMRLQVGRDGEKLETNFSILASNQPADDVVSDGKTDHKQAGTVPGPNMLDAPETISFFKELELAGGANVGATVRLRGNGFWQFSHETGMAWAGNVDYDVEGLTFGGLGGSYQMRVSFAQLNDWRGRLFDAYLLPTSDALSTENYPRLTKQQSDEINDAFRKSKDRITGLLKFRIQPFAPPPSGSLLDRTIMEFAEETISEPDTLSPGPHVFTAEEKAARRRADLIREAREVRQHWRRMRQLATVVPRQWSDLTGTFRVPARMLGRTETEVALLRTDNGQRINVPLDRLSEPDREIVQTFAMTAQDIQRDKKE